MAFFVPALIAGASALAGALANRKQKQTSETQQRQTGTNRQDFSSTTLPQYDPESLAFRNALLAAFTGRLQENPRNIADEQITGSLRDINQGSEIQKRLIQQQLALRGLNFSPASAIAPASVDASRIAQQNQVLGNRNTLVDSIMRNRLGEASAFLNSLPVGQTTSGSQTGNFENETFGTTTQTIPGNILGGAVSGLATTLAGLYGAGAFGGNKQTPPGPSFSELQRIRGQESANSPLFAPTIFNLPRLPVFANPFVR